MRSERDGIAVAIHGVVHSYDAGHVVLDHIDLEVRRGETLVLLGASGCGKSTLLRVVNRLVEPQHGTVEVFGKDVRSVPKVELRRTIGYASQASSLFPFLSVSENIAIPLQLNGADKTAQREESLRLLGEVELDANLADRYPDELSGGQAQRVGLARALAGGKRLILMDEPFGAVDAISRSALQDMALRLKAEHGTTIIFVTHDLFEAIKLADRIAILNQGRIEQIDSPERVVQAPATPFVAQLIAEPKRQLEIFAGTGV